MTLNNNSGSNSNGSWKGKGKFLLVINSNIGAVSQRFWNKATDWLKSQIFLYFSFI